MPPNDKAKPPAFQFYVRDWLSDLHVIAMTLEQRGAYITLLALAWNERNRLPADPVLLARLIGVDPAWFEGPGAQVLARFEPAGDGQIMHPRFERELCDSDAIAMRRSKAGRKAAKKRWSQAVENKEETCDPHANRNAIAMRFDGSSTASAIGTPSNDGVPMRVACDSHATGDGVDDGAAIEAWVPPDTVIETVQARCQWAPPEWVQAQVAPWRIYAQGRDLAPRQWAHSFVRFCQLAQVEQSELSARQAAAATAGDRHLTNHQLATRSLTGAEHPLARIEDPHP